MRVNVERSFGGANGAGVRDGMGVDWVTAVENSDETFKKEVTEGDGVNECSEVKCFQMLAIECSDRKHLTFKRNWAF